jgi:hypothetical protein
LRKVDKVFKSAVHDNNERDAQLRRRTLHKLTVQKELLNLENKNLRKAVLNKKKRSKKSEPLDLQLRKEHHNKPLFFSPRKVREARYRNKVNEGEKLEEEAAKSDRQQKRANTALQNKLDKERKSKAWREKQEESKRKKAEAEAEKQRKKEERDAAKAIQSPQLGKRKISQEAAAEPRKKQKPVGDAVGAVSGVAAAPRAPSPPFMLQIVVKYTDKEDCRIELDALHTA